MAAVGSTAHPDTSVEYIKGGCVVRLQLLLVAFISVLSIGIAQEQAVDYAIAARKLYEKGDLTGALTGYSKAIELDQTKAEYYFERGRVKLQLGRPANAAVDFDIAVTFDERYTEAWVQLGVSSFLQGRWRRAMRALNYSIFYDAKDPIAWYWRGRTLYELGNADGAQRSLLEALRHDKTSADTLHALGEAYAAGGKLQKAVLALTEAIQRQPKNPDLYCARALAQLQQASKDADGEKAFMAAAESDLTKGRELKEVGPALFAAAAAGAWLRGKDEAAAKMVLDGLKAVPPRVAGALPVRAWAVMTLLRRDREAAGIKTAVDDEPGWQLISRLVFGGDEPRALASIRSELERARYAFYLGVYAYGKKDKATAAKMFAEAVKQPFGFEGLVAGAMLRRLKK